MRMLIASMAATLMSTVAGAQTTPSPPSAAPPASNPPQMQSFRSFPVMPPLYPRTPTNDGRFFFRNPERLYPSSRFYENLYSQVQDYGRCVASVSVKRSRELLGTDPNTVDERAGFSTLVAGTRACLPYGYRAPTVFLRAGLAEGLFRREMQNGRRLSADATGAAAIRFLNAEQARSGARLIDDYRYSSVANCIVLHAPAAVQRVMMSKVGSKEEDRAIRNAVERSPTCSTTRTLPALASRPFIRAYLAESAYRWSTFAT